MRKHINVVLIIIFILMFNMVAYANSAPTYWTDYPSAGIMAVDKNTPIKVLKENLLFDFTDEQDNTYSPSAKVSAGYEMENSSKEDISVQMAFPFIERFDGFVPDDITITADDENVSYKLYMGDIVQKSGYPFKEPENTDFNIDNLLKSITDKKYVAKNFKDDELGKLYKFNVVSGDDNINFAVSFNFNREKTKIILNGFNRFERDDDYVRIASRAREEETLEIYVLGEDINFETKGYTDGRLDEETDNFEYEVITDEADVETYLKKYTDYYLKRYVSNYNNMTNDNVSDVQLYNLYAQSLDKYLDKNLGICTENDVMSQIRSARIMVLVYTIDFPNNSKREVSVSYKTKGTMDKRETSEPQYTYDYILNPAKNWKDFKNLNIKIIPPEEALYVVNSSIELNKEGNIYTAYSEKLPEEDFFFTLYPKEKITLSDRLKGYLNRNFGYFTPIVIILALLIIIIFISIVVKKCFIKKKRNL
nr:hypothetical protein [Sedimentibacter sp.]